MAGRLIIFDPGMWDLAGHHIQLNNVLCREAQTHGMVPMVFTHQGLRRSGRSWFIPFFRHDVYETVQNADDAQYLQALKEWNQAFYDDMWLLRDMLHLDASDRIVIHTVSANICLGLGHFLQALPAGGPSAHVHLMYEPQFCPGDARKGPLCARTWAVAAPLYSNLAAVTTFSAESIPVQEVYKPLGIDAQLALAPERFPVLPPAGGRRERRVLCIGNAREEKGIHHVATAAKMVLDAVPGAVFRFRSTDTTPEIARQLINIHPRVEVDSTLLSDADFLRELGASEYCACFYDPARYRHRTSNIFWEALAMGATPVLCAGMGAVDFLAHFQLTNAVVAPAYTPRSLADTLIEAMLQPRRRDIARDAALARELKAISQTPLLPPEARGAHPPVP